MISIGQFSKICSVSVKTLRYYDNINLIKPIMVDKFSGYRYYEQNQLNDILFIKRLKRYGFSLTEIKSFFDSGDKKALFSKLKQRVEDIKTQIDYQHILLNEIDGIINHFERTGVFMNYQNSYEITVSKCDKIYILSSKQRMSVEDFGKYYGKLFKKINDEKLMPTGIVLAIYPDNKFDENDTLIEVGVGINDKDKATNVIGGCMCAKTTHKGSYANLPEAYTSILNWINSNGYKISNSPFEIYRKDGSDSIPVDDWETDIYFPIENKK